MVTIIIPTYKRSDYLGRAIRSVLAQTYQDFEIIVVDDNDSDSIYREKNEKLMKKYLNNSKIKYIKHEKNMNGAVARNTAIKVAKGDYITFLDDDDFFLKDRLKIIVEEMKKNPKYNGAYTSGIRLDQGFFYATKSGNLQKDILMQNTPFKTGSNMFFKANVVKELKGFDESFIRHQDLEFMVRFFRKNEILAINSVLVVKDNSSRINELNIEKAIKAREKFLETFKEDLNKYEDKDLILQKNYINLLIEATKHRKKSYIPYLREKVMQYGEISKKLNLKLMIYSIFSFLLKYKQRIQKFILKYKIKLFYKDIDDEIVKLNNNNL